MLQTTLFWSLGIILLGSLATSVISTSSHSRLHYACRNWWAKSNLPSQVRLNMLKPTFRRLDTHYNHIRCAVVLTGITVTALFWLTTTLSEGWVAVYLLVCLGCEILTAVAVVSISRRVRRWFTGLELWVLVNGSVMFVTLGEPWILWQ